MRSKGPQIGATLRYIIVKLSKVIFESNSKKVEVILRMPPIRNFKPGENGVIYSKYKKKKMSIKTYMPGNFLWSCG